MDIAKWDDNDVQGFPYVLVVNGQPHGYQKWLDDYGFPAYERLFGGRIVTSRVDSQDLLVRFLIRNVADLYKMGADLAVVAEPIQTLAIFKERAWAVRIFH